MNVMKEPIMTQRPGRKEDVSGTEHW